MIFFCVPLYIYLGRRIAMLIFAAKLVFWRRKVGRLNKGGRLWRRKKSRHREEELWGALWAFHHHQA
jgi:hypothetical protein